MKKSFVLGIVVFMLLIGSVSFAKEKLDLAAPINITSYTVVRIEIDLEVDQVIIYLKNDKTTEKTWFRYIGNQAKQLIKDLNKGDFKSNSMEKTILQKLVTDGKVAGTVSGTPD